MTDTHTGGPLVSNRTYDILKPIVTVWLPGVSTLYFTLAQIWGLPNAEEVVGTIAAVNVFLGLLVGLSSKAYNHSDVRYDGSMVVKTGEDGVKRHLLELTSDPEKLGDQDEVVFKVKNGDV